MANNKHLLEWLIVVSISTASTFLAESLIAPAVGLNSTSPEAVAACKQIPHLEDYECDDYVKSMHKSLESKFEGENDNTKDWALISFIINRDGTIAKETVSNSTGNDEFNSQAGRILRGTKLAPLPEEVPRQVKSCHAFNYARVTKANHKQQTKPQSNATSANALASPREAGSTGDGFGDIIVKCLKEANLINSTSDTPNLRALCNIIGNCLYIFSIMFFYSMVFGAVPLFFVAGIVWWTHRIVLGRFPS